MYVESGDLETVKTLRGFDLCIAGAGAAGLVLAHRLTRSPLKVLAPGERLADRPRTAARITAEGLRGHPRSFPGQSRSTLPAPLTAQHVRRDDESFRILGPAPRRDRLPATARVPLCRLANLTDLARSLLRRGERLRQVRSIQLRRSCFLGVRSRRRGLPAEDRRIVLPGQSFTRSTRTPCVNFRSSSGRRSVPRRT